MALWKQISIIWGKSIFFFLSQYCEYAWEKSGYHSVMFRSGRMNPSEASPDIHLVLAKKLLSKVTYSEAAGGLDLWHG